MGTDNIRAMEFLEEAKVELADIPAEFRLQWALTERQKVVNTLQLERMKYRVASAVSDEAEKKAIAKQVGRLLLRQDEWDRIIAEIEADN